MANELLLDDVTDWLATLGIGLVAAEGAGRNVFKNDLPPDPKTAVGVFEYGGPDARVSFSGPESERPHVQFLVRAADQGSARLLMERIYQHVLKFRTGTIPGYLAATPNGTPTLAYRESQTNLAVFSLNVEFEKHLSSLT